MAKPTIVFFGNERLATGVTTTAPTLRALLAEGYDVAAVVSNYDASAPSRNARQLEIAAVAETHGIPLLLPGRLTDIAKDLVAYRADIGVLVAYGQLVPPAIIDLFPHGIINLHPSLLPKHRGPTPIESVILSGEAETGVSIMGLTPELDAGPLYAQETLALNGQETKQTLADTLLESGSRLLVETLSAIFSGIAAPQPQSQRGVSLDERLQKAAGRLNFQKPAVQLEREVRAYLGWPGSRTMLAGTSVTVTKSHIIEGVGKPGDIWHEAKEFGFYSISGILVVDSLKPAGKAEMSAAAYLAGHALP